ncbi:MAG: prohibitin family protein [Saprospiraceae bacterium]|nr:prohibitin family protein [Saprospiraceae bacterium]MCB9322351.1 prohibitin family protein [Lewinellaceae bacterium]
MISIFILISILLIIYSIIGLISGKRQSPINYPLIFPALIVGIILFSFSSMIVRVDPQQVGVLVTPTGVSDEELHTGWHIVMPWNDVHKMDKTVWVYTCTNEQGEGAKDHSDAIWAPTKDGIKMGIDISVSWRIDPAMASWIYQNVTENDGGNTGRYLWLEENVIRTKLKSTLALSVSNYTPIEVYSTKREAIQNDVIGRIRKEVEQYHLIIDQVDIREVYYNLEYEAAINNKKLAEQEALRLVDVTRQKEELLKQARIDKDIAIQQAEGEAKALQIKGSSIASNPKIIELEWINKWNGVLPTYMLGSGQGIMLNLDKKGSIQ